ncbi:MFS transporter [Naasia aerilata]|uniref:Cyanate transporter n=1 Tax=Naasia aerilata TaxID=1162966 RepID=A0ABM8GD84_9MICO|nr:MFS transporter [Naasia aerilata]BDZ46195.1 cyanate transporter [Naasia aerilata]
MRAAPSRAPWLVAVAIVALGLILRGPIIAVAPVIGDIKLDLSFTSAQAGLLTSVPVLCFALITPVASFLIARLGPDLATTLAILGVILGAIVRSAGGSEAVITGTILMGAFITVGNVVVPVLIRREVPAERARLATALYTSALNLGSVIGTFVTAPLAEAAGWRVSLAWWALFAAGILGLWLTAERRRALVLERAAPLSRAEQEAEDSSAGRAGRRSDALTGALLAIAFVGQGFGYYGITAWLPTLLRDDLGFDATQAGSAATVFQLLAIAGSIGVPLISQRVGLLPVTVAMSLAWLVVPVGLLLAPGGWLLWSSVGGVAQGAGITLVFVIIVEIARNSVHARRLSAVTQGVGYGFGGATAPTVLGAVHDATGAWTAPLLLVFGALVAFGVLITWTVARSHRRAPVPDALAS